MACIARLTNYRAAQLNVGATADVNNSCWACCGADSGCKSAKTKHETAKYEHCSAFCRIQCHLHTACLLHFLFHKSEGREVWDHMPCHVSKRKYCAVNSCAAVGNKQFLGLSCHKPQAPTSFARTGDLTTLSWCRGAAAVSWE